MISSDSASTSKEPTSFPYTDFIPTSRKKRKNKFRQERPPLSVLVQRVATELGHDRGWITQCQQILRDSLNSVSFTSPNVLCLGLGSPASSRDARVQLGFLLELCEHLDIDRAKVSIYDPVFTEDDKALLLELNLQLLTENRRGEYTIEDPTMLFMPHCDMSLYENILRANWARERLANVFFVANRLNDYVDSNSTHEMETKAPCLSRIVPFLDCQQLPASNCWPTAFNNMSVQFVGLQELASESWFSELPKMPTESESVSVASEYI